ncbi:hypothetical protein ACH41C_32475 [Streptomyces althioticus]
MGVDQGLQVAAGGVVGGVVAPVAGYVRTSGNPVECVSGDLCAAPVAAGG